MEDNLLKMAMKYGIESTKDIRVYLGLSVDLKKLNEIIDQHDPVDRESFKVVCTEHPAGHGNPSSIDMYIEGEVYRSEDEMRNLVRYAQQQEAGVDEVVESGHAAEVAFDKVISIRRGLTSD